MSNNVIDELPQWSDGAPRLGGLATMAASRRRILQGGAALGALAAAMSVFDLVSTRIPAHAGQASCGAAATYAGNCNGGATNTNNNCDKGCVSEPQHSFYCIGTSYPSRHRTCGEERVHTNGNRYSFTLRLGDCYSPNHDGWRWELGSGRCGCVSGKTKKTSCNDGYYATKPDNCSSCAWSPLATSVCRLHSACVTPTGN